MPGNYVVYTLCLLALAAIVIGVDHWFYPLLRDFPVGDQKRTDRPYSLGRVQMAVWTVIVVGSIVYVLIVTHGSTMAPAIDVSVAALLGISGATGVIAAGVDVGKDNQVNGATAAFAGTSGALSAIDTQIFVAFNQKDASGNRLPPGPIVAQLFADRASRMAELTQQSQAVKRSKRDGQRGKFWEDLLSDQNGNSLHRLQLILFTLIYGAYFVVHLATSSDVLTALKEPLSPSILGLMGVSGGIYAGFKLPGNTA
jgi:hypothetical protein